LLNGWPKTHFLPLEVEHDLTITNQILIVKL
jgi:hypothetical protein